MTAPTTNIRLNVVVTGKGLLAIGATVYVAARVGTRKAIRKEFRKDNGSSILNILTQVKQAMAEQGPGAAAQTGAQAVWDEVTDKVEEEKSGPGDTPDVTFGLPEQRSTSPGDEPTPPAGVGG